MKKTIAFKEGAASFYIVAATTLILIIIVTSFATIIISELSRTSNDDLSQSAYDSALAGIEDAKLAISNYRNCLGNENMSANPGDSALSCGEIVAIMEQPTCEMTGKILGRSFDAISEDVVIKESNIASNNMQQAYTCVKIQDKLEDYRSTLSSSDPSKVVKVKFDGVDASEIKQVRLSWFSDNSKPMVYTNFEGGKVSFPSLADSKPATPPTLELSLIQTAADFTLEQFERSVSNTTNRGTLFLVPVDDVANATQPNNDTAATINYIGAYSDGSNKISQSGFLKSNDKAKKNKPYTVYCPEGDNDFACTVTIDLPEPVNGIRNNDTFAFVVSLPYATPDTDFMMEFFCASGQQCAIRSSAVDGNTTVTEDNKAYLDGVQIGIDSTGRANDLYRRIETRLEAADNLVVAGINPLELLGGGDDEDVLKKDWSVICEYDYATTCP